MPAPTPRTRPSRCTGRPARTAVRRPSRSPARPTAMPPTATAPPARPPPRRSPPSGDDEEDEVARERAQAAQEEDDDDDFENAISLAAMEAELKPQVVDTFEQVADLYKKLRRLQDQDVENKLKNATLSPSQERRYKKLTEELVTAVKSLSLNQHRIDSLVEQLYDINKRLMGYEGRLLRLAEAHKVKREEFLKEYQGAELDPNWIRRISNLSAQAAGRNSSPRRRTASRSCARRSRRWPPRPASRSPSSAASSTWCRRASARRARRRRRWSRRTCAWSSRSPRNTPTAACSSWTSSRRATSA